MKKTKPPAKKKPAAAKKAKAPTKAKPKAPKKAAPKKPVAKAAPKKTAAAKPVKATKATKAAKATKTTKPAKPAKPVKKAPAAAAQKKTAAAKAAPKKVVAEKSAPVVKAPKAAKPVAKEAPAAAVTPAKTAKVPKGAKGAKGGKATKGESAKTAAPSQDGFPALDANVKRPAKPFFMEVKPGVERVIKRGDKSAISQVIDLQARRKGPAAEETPEELAERIERELQSQSFLKRNPMRPQLCTKCGINAVTPRFTLDRELGYCEICAEILHLGETKEARRMEINLAAKPEASGDAKPAGSSEGGGEDTVPEEVD